jgi:hypothetical protein
MGIEWFFVILIVVVVAWLLFRLLLKVTGLVFKVGCFIIFALALIAFLFIFIF